MWAKILEWDRPASGGRPSGNRTIIVRESYDGEHIMGSSGDHRQDAAGDPGDCRTMSGTWIGSRALGIYSVNILYKALDAIMARPPQHLQLALHAQRLICKNAIQHCNRCNCRRRGKRNKTRETKKEMVGATVATKTTSLWPVRNSHGRTGTWTPQWF